MKLTPEQIREYQDWVNKDNGERPLYKCDVDRLIAHITQLEAENAELREAINAVRHYCNTPTTEGWDEWKCAKDDAKNEIIALLPQPPEAKGE